LNLVKYELKQLHSLDSDPASELGQATAFSLRQAEQRMTEFLRRRKKSRLITGMTGMVAMLALMGFLFSANQKAKSKAEHIEAARMAKVVHEAEEAKAEHEAAEAKVKAMNELAEANFKVMREEREARVKAELEEREAKAVTEREATEAKAKLFAEIGSGQVGGSLVVPLLGKSVMPFSFCPAGSFTMDKGPAVGQSYERIEKVTFNKGLQSLTEQELRLKPSNY